MTTGHGQRSLYVLFALSGFSGLIYESVWSQYLKLLLGHAAYAQALVLVIFMGGMALGAWLISSTGHLVRNLLLGYALVEGIVGLFGLIFHPLFEAIAGSSFESIIPALGSPFYVQLYKVTAASLLILPQSILLGSTFPLMSGGFIRKYPDAPGKSISTLYFANSIGAAVALPVTGFYLIGKLGLPGTISTAGLLNIGIAVLVYGLAKGPTRSTADAPAEMGNPKAWPWLFIAASFCTGMASFIYEVAWIRMLSMVLGSSTHSFELMLSAFITGIAIGGYVIRKKIDSLKRPIIFVAGVQILKGLFALSTIFLYGYSFSVMSFFMAALDETTQGYALFSLASHSIALFIMLPATVCAGMTLPLFTAILYKHGNGERGIGEIYSSNTIGAIVGVVFVVYVGMPLLGLKGSILTGLVVDVAVGLALIYLCSSAGKQKQLAYIAASLGALVVVTMQFYELNARQMASGVFRHGAEELDDRTEILFHEDGKTASVTVSTWDAKQTSIMTNGKTDASITIVDNLAPTSDESTMVLLAALPLAVHPGPRTIANIGMGSGLTSQVALSMPEVERVDTIEIEEAMIRGARYFLPKTEKVFTDRRSAIHIDDARTFFSTHQGRYDVIISEPSNPWVSGVSSLFTREFYDVAQAKLNHRGIFVQWLHAYEFNIELLVSILKAISQSFPYYSLYFADEGNLILLASRDGPIDYPEPSIFGSPEMKELLSAIHVHNVEDLRFRFLGDQYLYGPFIGQFAVAANSDYYPVVDRNAERARFLRESASDLLDIRMSSVPILDILYEDKGYRVSNLTPTDYYSFDAARKAYKLYQFYSEGLFDKSIIESVVSLNFLLSASESCPPNYDEAVWGDSLYLIHRQISGYLGREELSRLTAAVIPECEGAELSAFVADWSAFFRSMNERDTANVIEAAKRLLAAGVHLNLEQRKFLSTALLASLVKTGENEQAAFLWREYMKELFMVEGETPLEIEILLAVAGLDRANW